jgi:rubrerythrin
MTLNTASQVISLARKLEEDGLGFYQDLAQRHDNDQETFLAFAKENRKNVVQVERAYYGVITDALEGCFAFAVEPEDYAFGTEIPQKESHAEALQRAIEMEERVRKFYVDAAEQSKSLMADVPRTFALIAKKRDQRLSVLRSLLGKGA